FAIIVEQNGPRSMSAFGPKRTSATAPHMSAFGGKADTPDLMPRNRPPRSCRSTKQIGTRARSIRFSLNCPPYNNRGTNNHGGSDSAQDHQCTEMPKGKKSDDHGNDHDR